MTESDLAGLGAAVLGGSFLASAAFGAIAQRTNFCTMGAVSDAVLMGDFTRARQWGLAASVAAVAFGFMVWLGWIDPSKTLYASSRLLWLSASIGGLMFGFGMVIASGCGSKTLVRVGAGNLKSLVVAVVMGVSAFITLKGLTAVIRVETVDKMSFDVGGQVGLPAALTGLGLPAETAYLLAAVGVLIGVLVWCLRSADFRARENWWAGLGVGCIVGFMWWVSARYGFVSEHPATLESAYLTTASGRAEAMSFVAPVAHTLDWLMFFSDKSKLLSFGVASVAGVVVGSAAAALSSGSFRWEGFRGPQDTGLHLAGGVLMGVGGVTAMGCTVGQGLSGISTLNWMSVIAVSAIIVGAIGGVRFQAWLLERED